MIRNLAYLVILMNLALLLVLWAGSLVNDRRRTHAQQDAQTAADFGEPVRPEVEAAMVYGPRAMYGPRDVVGDYSMPISQSETARQFRGLIAANEAGRINDEWREIGGAA